MKISPERIEEFKKLMKENYDTDLTDAEAMDQAQRLVGYVELALEVAMREERNKQKLLECPAGFSFMDGGIYSCPLCKTSMKDTQLWYDQYGMKCLNCQKALDTAVIPPDVFMDEDSFYSMHHIQYYFGLHSARIRKLIRDGVLQARIILNESNKPHEHIFLVKENEGVLPPKEWVEPVYCKTDDGSSRKHWYECVDPNNPNLKTYKIIEEMPYFKQQNGTPQET